MLTLKTLFDFCIANLFFHISVCSLKTEQSKAETRESELKYSKNMAHSPRQ